MAKASTKQATFSSNPSAVTAWIFLGISAPIWLKFVSIRLRIRCWMYSTNAANGRLEFFSSTASSLSMPLLA